MNRTITLTLYIFALLSAGISAQRAIALDSETTLEAICNETPSDIRCKGSQNPEKISLKERPGYLVRCAGSKIMPKSRKCNVSIENDSLVVYYQPEQQKDSTNTLIIPLSNVIDYSYPNFSRVTNLGYFGLIRATRKLGVIDMSYRASYQNQDNLQISLRRKKKELFGLVADIHDKTNYHQLTYQDNEAPIYQYVEPTFDVQTELLSKLTEEACTACNFAGMTLGDMELPNVQLDRVNLSRADLTGINLEGASLWQANLANAMVQDADLSSNNAKRTNLKQSYLVNANFQGSNLAGANLGRANLLGANLQGANLGVTAPAALVIVGQTKAKLNTHLAGANLENANLSDANLEKANLTHSNLIRANFSGAKLNKADLDSANLTDANLENAVIKNASLMNANLLNAKVETSQLQDALLCNTTLPNGDISNDNCETE